MISQCAWQRSLGLNPSCAAATVKEGGLLSSATECNSRGASSGILAETSQSYIRVSRVRRQAALLWGGGVGATWENAAWVEMRVQGSMRVSVAAHSRYRMVTMPSAPHMPRGMSRPGFFTCAPQPHPPLPHHSLLGMDGCCSTTLTPFPPGVSESHYALFASSDLCGLHAVKAVHPNTREPTSSAVVAMASKPT